MSKVIYLISGLGADERIFTKLDFDAHQVKHIRWIKPFENEGIKEYAARLQIQITDPKPIIISVSFGGMIATELAKIVDCEQVIIISSARNRYEIPFIYRLLGYLKFHKIMPAFILKRSNFATNWFFGMKTKNEQQLLKSILKDTDNYFLKWAMNAIITWKSESSDPSIVHIHGLADRILPFKYIKAANFTVKNGGHLMIYTEAQIINRLLSDILT